MDYDGLYADAKADIQKASSILFDFAVKLLAKQGMFLPFAATLESDGELSHYAAAPDHEVTNALEVLPLLHQGLRAAITSTTRAVVVCEWVKITRDDEAQTDAVKLLIEHRNGLVVALYLPMRKPLFRKWVSGEIFAVPATAEVGLVHRPT